MPTLAEIDAEIARRQQPEPVTASPALADIDAEIARRQSTEKAQTEEQQEQSGLGFGGIVEPAMAIGSGIASTIGGGIGGIAQTLNPFAEEGAGAEAVQSIQAGGTYQPRTEAGQANLKTLGELMEKGIDIARMPVAGITGLMKLISGQGVDEAAQTIKDIQSMGVGKVAGEKVFEETGSPLAATIAEVAPEAALSVAGFKPAVKGVKLGAKGVKAAGKAAGGVVKGVAKTVFSKQSAAKQRISELLQKGSADVSTAKYKLSKRTSSYKNRLEEYINSGKPLIEKDATAIESIKQGFDEGVIAAIKGSSPADKHAMLKMTAIMEKGKKNARFGVANRPGDVAGESLMKRFKVINRVNRKAGEQLDDVAKSLKGKRVDSDKAVSGLLDDLDDMGVSITDDLKLDFRGSDIEGVTGAENALSKIFARARNIDKSDAYDLHRMKRFIDENVSYGKSAEGLTGKSERVLKKLRANIDESLDSNFPRYDKVNTRYAETRGVLDSLQDIAGKKMDLTGPNVDKAVGTVIRRLMSNTQSRVRLLDTIEDLEGISKKYGAQFNDDLLTQALFVDELDSVFGPAARTSFQGQIGQAVERTAEAVTSPGSAAIKAVGKGADKLRGINQENAFKSIKKLLVNQ